MVNPAKYHHLNPSKSMRALQASRYNGGIAGTGVGTGVGVGNGGGTRKSMDINNINNMNIDENNNHSFNMDGGNVRKNNKGK